MINKIPVTISMVYTAHQEKTLTFPEECKPWTLKQWPGVLWSYDAKFTVIESSEMAMYWSLGWFTYHCVGGLVLLPKNSTVNCGSYLLLCDHPDRGLLRCAGLPLSCTMVHWHWPTLPFFEDWPANCKLKPHPGFLGNHQTSIMKLQLSGVVEAPSCTRARLEFCTCRGACRHPSCIFTRV